MISRASVIRCRTARESIQRDIPPRTHSSAARTLIPDILKSVPARFLNSLHNNALLSIVHVSCINQKVLSNLSKYVIVEKPP